MPDLVFPEKPVWEPLKRTVGCRHKEFMFMGKVPVGCFWVFLYKHINTRRYLNLDGQGNAYAYRDRKYSPVKLLLAIERVF